QIILGKVRPFLRRLAEAHPQVLIIALVRSHRHLGGDNSRIAEDRQLHCENRQMPQDRTVIIIT
ncbi:hypothetical protein, partial [Mycobacteroides abscessus]|uniref:hypothetical protein n=1 Tax=Mycobacteroides abscessus TaxID=36809 RepID=UPI001A95AD8F